MATLLELMAKSVVSQRRAVEPQVGRLNAGRLVVLRMGLGRDSMTMLVLLAQRELVVEGKKRGPDEVDAVVFTDPGHEWSFTYDLIPRVEAFCRKYGIRFLWQKKPPAAGSGGWVAWKLHQVREREAAKRQGRGAAFGKPPWQVDPPGSVEARCASGYYHDRIPLFEDYGSKDAWISKDDSSCTINHKIEPGRKLVVDLQVERFGLLDARGSSRRAPHTQQGGAWSDAVERGERLPHLMLIGYAADEEKRVKSVKEKKADWSKHFDTEAYPLMEMGITKAGEAKYLESLPGVDPSGRFVDGGFKDVKKSGCRSCIHQDRAQWWMLRTLDPAYFRQIEEHEARVVKRTGPWQAVFPEHYVAVGRRVARGAVPEVTPELAKARRAGFMAVLARKVENPEGNNPEYVWARVPDVEFDVDEDLEADEHDRCTVFIWRPLGVQVDGWLAKYRAEHGGKRPDVEEVARKEYRGCPMEKIG